MKSARFVHLAPHGLSEEYRNGEIPGAIPLAPSSTDDGFLTASEIVTMRLNAEMVVLSACKTGQGLLTGDGVIGLSRSLISAGVPSAVVSLWAVPKVHRWLTFNKIVFAKKVKSNVYSNFLITDAFFISI